MPWGRKGQRLPWEGSKGCVSASLRASRLNPHALPGVVCAALGNLTMCVALAHRTPAHTAGAHCMQTGDILGLNDPYTDTRKHAHTAHCGRFSLDWSSGWWGSQGEPPCHKRAGSWQGWPLRAECSSAGRKGCALGPSPLAGARQQGHVLTGGMGTYSIYLEEGSTVF